MPGDMITTPSDLTSALGPECNTILEECCPLWMGRINNSFSWVDLYEEKMCNGKNLDTIDYRKCVVGECFNFKEEYKSNDGEYNGFFDLSLSITKMMKHLSFLETGVSLGYDEDKAFNILKSLMIKLGEKLKSAKIVNNQKVNDAT